MLKVLLGEYGQTLLSVICGTIAVVFVLGVMSAYGQMDNNATEQIIETVQTAGT